jgi:hypothetical protein
MARKGKNRKRKAARKGKPRTRKQQKPYTGGVLLPGRTGIAGAAGGCTSRPGRGRPTGPNYDPKETW